MNAINIRSHGRLALAISLALAAASAHAVTITVNSADDDAASTFCNLRDALTSINNGSATPTCSSAVTGGVFGNNDTILFASGLANATITLTQGELGIIGAAATITGSGQIIDAAGASRVFIVSDLGTAAASNLDFTDGHSVTYGGAINVDSGSALNLTTCSVSNSSAVSHGGGIYAKNATLTLTNTIVSNNAATAVGGGIYAYGGALTLNTSTVASNTATDKAGGVWSGHGNILAIDHSTVSGNTGLRDGGVYVAYQSTGTLSSSTISGNTATCASNSFCGGGIYVYSSDLIVIDSTITGNTVSGNGDHFAGAAYIWNSNATFINSTITGNSATGNSYLAGGLFELHYTTSSGSLTLINSTVASNTATSYGAGPYVGGGVESGLAGANALGTLTLANTIVSSNAPAGSDVLIGTGTTTLSTAYNLLGLAQNVSPFNDAANHNIFSDTPGLGPLQNNGGPTGIMPLTLTSPALRAGSVSLAVYSGQPLYFDQRGISYSRTFSGTVDIGAFEYQDDRIFANGLESAP